MRRGSLLIVVVGLSLLLAFDAATSEAVRIASTATTTAAPSLPFLTYPAAKLPPSPSAAANLTHVFLNATLGGVETRGNLLTLGNPVDHFLIGLPGGPNATSGDKQWTTATAAAYGCTAATNAGFFVVADGSWIGHVVSNGAIKQTWTEPAASFGLTKSGEYVIGYLSPDQVETMGFTQLVSGVGWLVKDGVAWVNESIAIEKPSHTFVTEAAPRLIIGHDADGVLMIFEVLGNELDDVGPNLYDMTALALEFGFVNAINLDGGGSDTVVLNNVICSACGSFNNTCDGSDARLPLSALGGPRKPSPTPAPAFEPCDVCGIALDGRDVGSRPHPSSQSAGGATGVAAALGDGFTCQRLVTTVTCIV